MQEYPLSRRLAFLPAPSAPFAFPPPPPPPPIVFSVLKFFRNIRFILETCHRPSLSHLWDYVYFYSSNVMSNELISPEAKKLSSTKFRVVLSCFSEYVWWCLFYCSLSLARSYVWSNQLEIMVRFPTVTWWSMFILLPWVPRLFNRLFKDALSYIHRRVSCISGSQTFGVLCNSFLAKLASCR